MPASEVSISSDVFFDAAGNDVLTCAFQKAGAYGIPLLGGKGLRQR